MEGMQPNGDQAHFDVEVWMRKISIVISALGLGLMVFGYVDIAVHGASVSIPGASALLPKAFKPGARISWGLATMSLGIIVLSLLPVLRVLLALLLYLRDRQALNIAAAIIVVVELLVSFGTGG